MKLAALILDGTARIFEVDHIVNDEFFADNALQYMAERTDVKGDIDGFHFADSHAEMAAYLADRRIKIAA